MYNIKEITLGETLKEYRKIKKMTLQEVGEKVCKSKVTICKYEKNEILPDIYTLLELCNTLDINISQLCEETDEICVDLENPFKKNKLYLYYYSTNKLIGSMIKLEKSKDKYKVKFFNEMTNQNKKCNYYYEGEMTSDNMVTYLDLNTTNSRVKEKIHIIVNVPWSINTEVYKSLYTGMNKDGLPVVKKALISKNKINNFEKYDNQLKFSKEESKKIYKENAFVFSNNECEEYICM